MLKYEKLSSEIYYNDKVRQDIYRYRRQQGKAAVNAMFSFLFFIGGLATITFGFSRGWFDDVDVLGAFEFTRDVVQVALTNLGDSIRGFA